MSLLRIDLLYGLVPTYDQYGLYRSGISHVLYRVQVSTVTHLVDPSVRHLLGAVLIDEDELCCFLNLIEVLLRVNA